MNAPTTGHQQEISDLVNEVFDECRCESVRTEVPHDGSVVGLLVGHSCNPGQLTCLGHVKHHVDVIRPQLFELIATYGAIECSVCSQPFTSVDSFLKLYVF